MVKTERHSRQNISKKHRPKKGEDGLYRLNNKGKTWKYLRGTRREVWNHTAFETEGRLQKEDLLQPKKNGHLVSRVKHEQSKKDNNLLKAGWAFAEKGKFGPKKLASNKKNKSRKNKK